MREGHSESFLPLPVPAAAAGSTDQQEQRVLEPCALADVPLNRWLVKNAEAGVVVESQDNGLELLEVRHCGFESTK